MRSLCSSVRSHVLVPALRYRGCRARARLQPYRRRAVTTTVEWVEASEGDCGHAEGVESLRKRSVCVGLNVSRCRHRMGSRAFLHARPRSRYRSHSLVAAQTSAWRCGGGIIPPAVSGGRAYLATFERIRAQHALFSGCGEQRRGPPYHQQNSHGPAYPMSPRQKFFGEDE